MVNYSFSTPVLWAVASGGSLPPTYLTFARSEESAAEKFGLFGKGGHFRIVTQGDVFKWKLAGMVGLEGSKEPVMGCLLLKCNDTYAVLLS